MASILEFSFQEVAYFNNDGTFQNIFILFFRCTQGIFVCPCVHLHLKLVHKPHKKLVMTLETHSSKHGKMINKITQYRGRENDFDSDGPEVEFSY